MRRTLILFVVLALGATHVSYAQQDVYLRRPHTFVIFADMGIAMPAAPGAFRDAWNTTLPFTVGVGVAALSWLEVSGSFAYYGFGNNALESKRQIGYQGVNSVKGGNITTLEFMGRARFIGVPNQRFNPFAEVCLGYFSTSAEQLEIDNVLVNSMESVSGPAVGFGGGVQYALNEYWSAYTKYTWYINRNRDFAPTNLLLGAGETPIEYEDNQQFSAIVVGIMLRM